VSDLNAGGNQAMQITIDRAYSIRRMRQAGLVVIAGSLLAFLAYSMFLMKTDHVDALSLPENTRPMIMMPHPKG